MLLIRSARWFLDDKGSLNGWRAGATIRNFENRGEEIGNRVSRRIIYTGYYARRELNVFPSPCSSFFVSGITDDRLSQ